MDRAAAGTIRRNRGRRVVGAIVAFAVAVVPVLVVAAPAEAATALVSVTPASTTAESNTPVTFTVSVTCNGPGQCDGAQVSFPREAVTGNGSRTEVSTWIGNSSCGGVTRSVTATDVVFTYATLAPGTQNCTFVVRAPEYTTFNGAVATLTPTVSGPGIPAVTGTAATLTLTAGHNASTSVTGPSRILSGQTYSYSIIFNCGAQRQYDGDIGVSALHLEAVLPANFAYSSYTPRNSFPGTYTPPAVGSTGGTFVFDDPTGASCSTPLLNIDNAVIIVVSGSVTAPVGTTACLSATHTFTYLDRTTPESTTGTTATCPTVVNLATTVSKTATTQSMGNVGQYLFGGARYAYTFPGDWDQTQASLSYVIKASTNPSAIAAGIAYQISDPLPCLDNLSGIIYSSNASGVPCANPGFVPARITVTGFTPTAAHEIHLLRADGSTTDVAYASGGWTIPTTGSPVSEIQIPPFAAEGSNTAAVITFTVDGYASPSAVPGRVLRNTMTSQAYLADSGDAIGTPQTAVANAGIVDQLADAGEHGNPVFQPFLTNTVTGTCTAAVGLRTASGRGNALEITKGPNEAIYFSYLAPEGATIATPTVSPTFRSLHLSSRTYAAGSLTPTITPDHAGTGRTLYTWTVPAGVITIPGVYEILNFSMSVDLGAGCAGTYESDITVGYQSAITKCIWTNYSSPYSQDAPLYPLQNSDLRANGGPIADNYCGYSSPITVAAVNPGFSIDKSVQGSLDAAPAALGTTGKVGVSGGEATYSITFVNSGESVLTDPVLYDILPRVGDTEATSTDPRNSQFAAALASIGTLPPGVSVQYSTAENPCRPEVLDDNPGCVSDWTSTAPTPVDSTTALRFVYTGTLQVSGGGGTTSFTVSYDVTTPPVAAGRVAWNSVGANANAGGSLIGAAESTSVGLEADGQPAIVKTSSSATFAAVGDTVTFSYEVSNEASVPVTGVSVSDAFTDAAAGSLPGAVTCQSLSGPAGACSGSTTDLAAGQTATFSMTYTVRQADLDHGLIVDRATVSATPGRGPALTNTSNAVTVSAVQSPALSLVKSVLPTTVDAAGDTVAYSFEVTNTGNVTLDAVGVTESAFSGTGTTPVATCPSGSLAPADAVTCTAAYTITRGDMDAGSVDNTAVALAEFGGAGVLSPSSAASVDVLQDPSLALVKSALPTTLGAAGQRIDYSFLVTNDGNVTIGAIDVQETAFSGSDPLDPVVCPATALAPGDDMTCTTSYVATQADVDSGSIDNTATVAGEDPSGAPLADPPSSSFSVTVVFAPALTILKTADVARVDRAGDVIRYEFLVMNNGNTTLSDLAVDELTFTGAGTLGAVDCPVTTLAPAAQTTCTADYTVVAADAGGRLIENTARALATYALGEDVVDVASDDSAVSVAVGPGVTAGLAATGSDVPRRLGVVGALAVLIGLGLVMIGRRRLAGF